MRLVQEAPDASADLRRSLAKFEEGMRGVQAALGPIARSYAKTARAFADAQRAFFGTPTAEDRLYARRARRALARSVRNQSARKRRPHGRPR